MLAPQTAVSLAEAQDLIFLEAELLDDWRLDDWLKLYTDDMTYLVPSPGMPMDCSPDTSLFLIYDDRFRMESRVKRLKKQHGAFGISALDHRAHVRELARRRAGSPTARMVHGVFNVSRYSDGITDIFMGRVRYQLVQARATTC